MPLLLLLLLSALPAGAQEIPREASHCNLQAPPEAAAKGIHPPRRLPMRLFPVNPGAQYTGCQWIWISYGTPTHYWDFWSVTYYEAGTPRVQHVRFPPLPVQPSVQKCVHAPDGQVRKIVEGNDWQQDCRSARELRNLLVVTPKENEVWDFF